MKIINGTLTYNKTTFKFCEDFKNIARPPIYSNITWGEIANFSRVR